MKELKIKLDEGAIKPTRAHANDAGLDLHCLEGGVIWPFGHKVFDTGVHFEMPDNMYGIVANRSGLNFKKSIVLGGTGTVDSNFRGSVKAKLYNLSWLPYRVKAGDRIAQIVLSTYESPEINIVDSLGDSDRGENGYGSSGR